jgi:hypothetical protein
LMLLLVVVLTGIVVVWNMSYDNYSCQDNF